MRAEAATPAAHAPPKNKRGPALLPAPVSPDFDRGVSRSGFGGKLRSRRQGQRASPFRSPGPGIGATEIASDPPASAAIDHSGKPVWPFDLRGDAHNPEGLPPSASSTSIRPGEPASIVVISSPAAAPKSGRFVLRSSRRRSKLRASHRPSGQFSRSSLPKKRLSRQRPSIVPKCRPRAAFPRWSVNRIVRPAAACAAPDRQPVSGPSHRLHTVSRRHQ